MPRQISEFGLQKDLSTVVGRRKHGSSFTRMKTSPLDWEKVAYLIILSSLDPRILVGLDLCVQVHTGMD